MSIRKLLPSSGYLCSEKNVSWIKVGLASSLSHGRLVAVHRLVWEPYCLNTFYNDVNISSLQSYSNWDEWHTFQVSSLYLWSMQLAIPWIIERLYSECSLLKPMKLEELMLAMVIIVTLPPNLKLEHRSDRNKCLYRFSN